MGCCCLAVLAAFVPRIALLFMWIFTDYVSRAFSSFIWPLLGLVFLPYTTIVYSLAYVPAVGVTGWRWLWVILALILDLASYGGGGYSKSKQGVDGGD